MQKPTEPWLSEPRRRWPQRPLALLPEELQDAAFHVYDMRGADALRPPRPPTVRDLRIVFEGECDAVDGLRYDLNVIWCRLDLVRRVEQTLAVRNGIQEP